MEQEARKVLHREGFPEAKQRHVRSLAVRYKGQSFELEIWKTSGNIAEAFHRAHTVRYGYAQKTNPVEVVSARLRSTGIVEKVSQPRNRVRGKRHVRSISYSRAFLGGKNLRVGIYRREELMAGMRLSSPCIVTEYSTTTLIPTDARAEVDAYGNLIIET